MRAHMLRSAVVLLWTAVPVVVATRAFAGPDPGVIEGSTALFSGNQTDGIRSGVDFDCPPVLNLYVRDLTSVIDLDRAEFAGLSVAGVGLPYIAANGANGGGLVSNGDPGQWAENLFIDFDAGAWLLPGNEYGFLRTGQFQWSPGITARSKGGDGGNGRDAYVLLHAGHGGFGRPGGDVTIRVNVENSSGPQIMTGNNYSHGIWALSEGGEGGDGGDAWGIWVYGGDGGPGGDGGLVTVDASAWIQTAGLESYGILAQSLGGANGVAGKAGGIVAGGGDAGSTGAGRDVNVTSSKYIETRGKDSDGILAQSIGGFARGAGGAGGLFYAYGGSGASSGDGGLIRVNNTGPIRTKESGSSAIIGQSIGGGGGRAGEAGAISAVGGTGGAGGNGGQVDITNSGLLLTYRDYANGVVAQSIGGGGGIGGGAGGALSIVGGAGAAGGDGGWVTVTNTGRITTSGNVSDAISAQSIGGGGGRARAPGGGFYVVGGSGGAGGAGGDVHVFNQGNLTTAGARACAISAQSIGGGGGRGADAYGVYVDTRPGSVDLDQKTSIGGEAGGGGDAGLVDIDSGAVVLTTHGDFSHGIQAQGIGGGGGAGGNAFRLSAAAFFNSSLAVGGGGGAGGNGGTIHLTSDSQVSTHGENAHALSAQSIGAGGGFGGTATSRTLTVGDPTGEIPVSIGVDVSVGGTGGDGGDGQQVTLNNTGDLVTRGFRSYGISAQSVGGGGGDGGNVDRGGLTFAAYQFSLLVGGQALGGGSGHDVVVDSAGSIGTQGHSAYGILAQSIGGGGGAGGNSNEVSVDVPDVLSLLDYLVPSTYSMVQLGGGGGGGAGALADVTNRGVIATEGAFAHGIVAQSIGGGGGVAGETHSLDILGTPSAAELAAAAACHPIDDLLTFGGGEGGGGPGGAVSVDNQDNITTRGDMAQGILAQSVGGGGGAAGVNIEDDWGLINGAESAFVIKLSDGSGSGDGGAVSVSNSAAITTHGGFGHGIMAQSIAGGGGFAVINEDSGDSTIEGLASAKGIALADTAGLGIAFAGSCGGSGLAGPVTVTHTGSITALGDHAYGILAQSVGGTGTGGNITITIGSGGTVWGGSGGGAGVVIDGGAWNTLTNAGSISALSGTAVVAGVGDDTIYNNGVVTGNVHLGSGTNAFHNNAGATFNMGSLVELGNSNSLTNQGILSPGGAGAIAETLLDGDLIQLATGLLEIDLRGFASGTFDYLQVTGALSGGSDTLGSLPVSGTVRFALMPGFDLASVIGPGQSNQFQFLYSELEDWTFAMSCDFSACPQGFDYEVYQDETGGAYFRATNLLNLVPEPATVFLLAVGGLLAIRRSRKPYRQTDDEEARS